MTTTKERYDVEEDVRKAKALLDDAICAVEREYYRKGLMRGIETAERIVSLFAASNLESGCMSAAMKELKSFRKELSNKQK